MQPSLAIVETQVHSNSLSWHIAGDNSGLFRLIIYMHNHRLPLQSPHSACFAIVSPWFNLCIPHSGSFPLRTKWAISERNSRVSVCGSSLSNRGRGAVAVKPSRLRGRSEMAPRQGDSGIMHDAHTLAHGTSWIRCVTRTRLYHIYTFIPYCLLIFLIMLATYCKDACCILKNTEYALVTVSFTPLCGTRELAS